MGAMKEWLLEHIEDFTDEELHNMGYDDYDIAMFRGYAED